MMEGDSKKEREAALNHNRVYNNKELHKKIKLVDKLGKKVERENAKEKDLLGGERKKQKKECERIR